MSEAPTVRETLEDHARRSIERYEEISIPRPAPPSRRHDANEVERISRGRCASLPRSDPLRAPRRFSSARHLRSTAAGYTGGCPAIVTLALLIACPTKVYHYHRHPSCPPSALNPLVSRCTYCSVFLSLRRSPFPSATYHSSWARLHPPLSLYLSLSLFLPFPVHSPHRSSSPPGHTLARVLEPWYYQAWKLRLALFELFATVLIRFIAAAWPRQAARIQFHPPTFAPRLRRDPRDKPTSSGRAFTSRTIIPRLISIVITRAIRFSDCGGYLNSRHFYLPPRANYVSE